VRLALAGLSAGAPARRCAVRSSMTSISAPESGSALAAAVCSG